MSIDFINANNSYLYKSSEPLYSCDILGNNKNITDSFNNSTNITNYSQTDTFKNSQTVDIQALEDCLAQTKAKQGLIEKLWDGFKNLTNIGAGSDKTQKAIEDYKKGLISEEKMLEKVNGYKEGQDMVVDVVADIASGILSIGAFALAVPTAGASLIVGLSAATAIGAGVKVGIKAGDAILTGKQYLGKDLLYDSITGAVNGLLAPITNGVGNTVTKTIGKKIIQESAEETAGQVVKQSFKQVTKNVILNQTYDIIGGTIGKRALAYGAGMAVDGALSGSADNMVRAGLNGENVLKAGVQGALGGLIMSPIIGGGFRLAGKGANKLGNKIFNNSQSANLKSTNLDVDFDNIADNKMFVNFYGKKIPLEQIIDSDGTNTIKQLSIKYRNRKYLIVPQSYTKDGNFTPLETLVNFNGVKLNSQLDKNFLTQLRNKSGREITNYDIIASSGLVTSLLNKIPNSAKEVLNDLKITNPDKHNLVMKVLKNTKLHKKTIEGISNDYIFRFIKKLSECDDILLKNVVDNNIKVSLYDDLACYQGITHANYSQGKKFKINDGKTVTNNFGKPVYDIDYDTCLLNFCERTNGADITILGMVQDTTESLPHELGHAYDYLGFNKHNLTKQDVLSTIKGEDFSRFENLISMSKEFDEAITKDIILMSEKDLANGRRYGQTFEELLSSERINYYFGVNSGDLGFNDITARKELFAQLVSYATSGKVSVKAFQDIIEDLLPNTLEFTKTILNKH